MIALAKFRMRFKSHPVQSYWDGGTHRWRCHVCGRRTVYYPAGVAHKRSRLNRTCICPARQLEIAHLTDCPQRRKSPSIELARRKCRWRD
jgi:hypothetical protein